MGSAPWTTMDIRNRGGRALLVLFTGSLAHTLTGCATQLGYHYEDTRVPRDTRVVSQTVSDPVLKIAQRPSKDDPTVAFQAKATQKRTVETSFDVQRVRVERSIEYNPGYDIIEPVIGCVVAPFDLLSRLFGQPGFRTVEPAKYDGDKLVEREKFAEWDEYKPDNWYWVNLWTWLGWVLPGMNAFTEWENPYQYTKTPVATSQPAVTTPVAESKAIELTTIPVLLDLGPAGTTTVKTDASGTARVNLTPFLPRLQKDAPWKISAALPDYPNAAPAEFVCNATDLGVTWTMAASEGDRQAFEAALAAGTAEALRDFVNRHPMGPYAEEARRRVTELSRTEEENAAKAAFEADSVSSLQQFIARYPSSVHSDRARSRLADLQQKTEERAFTEAVKTARAAGDASALDRFLKEYPHTSRAREIARIKWELLPKVRITGSAIFPDDIPILEGEDANARTIEKVSKGKIYAYRAESNEYFAVILDDGKVGYVRKSLAEKEN